MNNFTYHTAANDENYNDSKQASQMPTHSEEHSHNYSSLSEQTKNAENLHSFEDKSIYTEWSCHNGKIEIASPDGEKSVYIWDFIIKNGEKIPQGKGILKEQKSDGLKNWSGDFEDGKCVSGTRRTEMNDGEIREFKGTFHNNEPDTGDALQIFADWRVGRGRVDRGLIIYFETQLPDGQFMVGEYGLYTVYADETRQKRLLGPAYMNAEQAEIYKKRKTEDNQKAEYEKQQLQENKAQDEDKKLQENREKENQKIFSSNLLIVAQEVERVKKALIMLSNAEFYSSVDFIRELGRLSDTLSATSKESMSKVDLDKLSQFIRKTKNRSYHEAFEMNVPGVDNLYHVLDELERYFSHVKK